MGWVQPSELGASPPRQVRLTGGGSLLLAMALVVLTGGVIAGFLIQNKSARQTQTQQVLEEQGSELDAIVTRKWVAGAKSQTRRIGYEFRIDGAVIRGDAAISRRAWEALSEGSRVRIRYLQVNPMINRPVDAPEGPAPMWLSWAVPSIAVVISLFMWTSLRRQKRLLERGQAAAGKVTRVATIKSNKILEYHFVLPDGSTESGKGGGRRRAEDVGSQVTVIYDPQDPKRNRPYPFDLVRPA